MMRGRACFRHDALARSRVAIALAFALSSALPGAAASSGLEILRSHNRYACAWCPLGKGRLSSLL